MLVFTGPVSAIGLPMKVVLLSDNGGDFKRLETSARTVEDFFAERHIELQELDRASVELSAKISDYMMIKIYRAFYVTLIVDGDEVRVKTNKLSVGDFMRKYSEEEDAAFHYDVALTDEVLTDGYTLELAKTFTDIITVVEYVPFETVSVPNADITGEEIVSDGVFGERVIKTAVTYEDGKLVDSKVIYDSIDFDPVTRVVYMPTPKNVSSSENETIEYSERYTMRATAYTLDPLCVGIYYYGKYHGLTASGMKARVGVVAVDPKVIPLGTELYITGYGYAIAGDTGGAIKGNKIDLFFDTLAECYQYGARQVEVYVISQD
jgi:3D (Asp-Asp-Asp) domain-containing protein